MNRKDFQELALIRLKEASVLLRNGNYEGAYYLCGYVVEFGLKACIARKTKRYDFPPDKKAIEQIYHHDLTKLIGAAGLGKKFEDEIKKDKLFDKHWAVVKHWSEQSRYEKHGAKEAQDLYSAIADTKSGVLRWIKRHW